MAGRYLQTTLVLLFMMIPLHAQTGMPSALPDGLSAATEETDRSNSVMMGLRVSSEFDDNALNDNRNKRPNLMTVIEPHVIWKRSRPRLEWTLGYSNGFATSYQLSAYSSQSHLLDAGLGVRPTRRLRVTLNNSFLKSTNPFDF